MERQRLFTLFFLTICVLIAGSVLYILSPFFKPILWAVLFTIIFNPLRNFLIARIKRPVLVSVIITAFTLFLFVVPLTAAGIMAFKEVMELSRYLIAKYKQISPAELQHRLLSAPVVKFAIKSLPEGVIDSQVLLKSLMANLKAVANFSASQIKELFFSMGVLVSELFIFLFALFFLLKDAHIFGEYIYRFTPLGDEDKRDILNSIYTTTISVVYGTVGTAISQGAVSLVAYLLLGVPYPYLWALATSYASFIPPFGASMVWFPVAVYLLVKVSWIRAAAMLVVGVGLISSLDNVVKPMIMKNRVNAPYIVIFFSIFGGLIKFGFIGMFLGPILFNLLFTLAKIYEQKFLASRDAVLEDRG